MTYNLFLDDERDPPANDQEWVIVRTSDDAMAAVEAYGIPSFISFDHDLGGDDTAMKFLRRFADHVLDTGADLTGMDFYVHSQNPVGRDNIVAFVTGLKAATKSAWELPKG
jgi:hypothetical protein